MIQYIFLSIAFLALLNLLLINILEIITYYHDNYSCAAHPGRIRGASEPAAVDIGGIRYNVKWLIRDGEKVGDL